MTEADLRDDVIFELHLNEGEAHGNATLVRLVRAYPDLREDLLDHWCEIVLMKLRAAAYPEPECPPVDEDVAARALARFREFEAEVLAQSPHGPEDLNLLSAGIRLVSEGVAGITLVG